MCYNRDSICCFGRSVECLRQTMGRAIPADGRVSRIDCKESHAECVQSMKCSCGPCGSLTKRMGPLNTLDPSEGSAMDF